jgi:hypothetical protein
MQLSFIELLYVSAQPLHKVNITKGNPIEGYAVLALLGRGKVSLDEAWRVLSSKSSLTKSDIRFYMQ